MQQARSTLRKIFADKVCGKAGEDAPLLAWPVVCGAAVAGKTQALSVVDGLLLVAVPDKAWRNQLQGMAAQYLAGVNQLAGNQVKSISFVVAPQSTRTTM